MAHAVHAHDSTSASLDFVQNQGQWNPEVAYHADVQGGRLFLTQAGFTYNFYSQEDVVFYHEALTAHLLDSLKEENQVRFHALKVTFPGSNPTTALQPHHKKDAWHNYYLGNDPASWSPKTPLYEQVAYERLYPGIDLQVYSHGPHLKYDFICAPGADPGQIALQFEGQETLLLKDGNLQVGTSVNTFQEQRPVAWQLIAGERVSIPCEFKLEGNLLSFHFPGGYDPDRELVIDPEVIFASWSGSLSPNWGSCATEGPNKSLVTAGISFTVGYPTTTGAYQQSFAGGFQDAVITAFSADGSTLLYSTYLGGADMREFPCAMEFNDAGELFFLGVTNSNDFPVTAGAYDPTFNFNYDLFLCRFAPGGTNLIASTYIGGSNDDGVFIANTFDSAERSGLVLDEDDNVYVASNTFSFNFPRSNSAYQNNFIGFYDGVVFKMPPSLNALTWGTFLGGTQTDAVFDLKLDDNRNVYVCGVTSSIGFPSTGNGWQSTHGGNWDGFVAQLSADGTALLASTFIGTGTYENALMLERYENGDLLVTGGTMNPTFPTTPGTFTNPRGNNYIMRFSPDLQTLRFSSVFGPGRNYPDITPTAFRLDSCERIQYAGWASFHRFYLPRMPITPDAYQSDTDTRNFYVSVFAEDMRYQVHGTFFGGSPSHDHTHARDMYFDDRGVLYHAACTGCRIVFLAGIPPTPGAANHIRQHTDVFNDFPATPGAWAKNPRSPGCNLAAFKLDMDLWEVEGDFEPSANAVCLGDSFTFEDRSDGGQFFNWDFGDGQTAQGEIVTHTYDAPGTYIVEMIVEDTLKCLPFDTVEKSVTVWPLPPAEAGPDVIVCPQNGQRLQGSGGTQYLWSPPDGLSSSTRPDPLALPESNTTYTLLVTDANGCQNTDSTTVSVLPMISNFAWSPPIPLPGETVQFTDLTFDANDWQWDFGDGQSSTLENPTHVYSEEGEYVVTLIVQNDLSCEETLTKVIEVVAETGVYVPNAFTPNGDGRNDQFTIIGMEIQALQMTIYDRWGKELFTSDGLNDFWDGTYEGQPLPQGVYPYRLLATLGDGKTVQKTGTVTLIR